MMKLFHGSYVAIEKPDISFSRDNLDFGRGFNTTPIYEQAAHWTKRFKKRRGVGVISSYEIDMDILQEGVKILTFYEHSDEWLDFIVACRRGMCTEDFDIVIGGVANDRVFDSIHFYLEGLIDKAKAINRLKYGKPNIQYCFRNQAVINEYLKYLGSEVL
ncbi:MAG: DUF3990 domain-containing protein [Defluviitaleaceae bacterium]|nr:DUF3990 domain-containing protein [Defluviitaleaceae bacterium]